MDFCEVTKEIWKTYLSSGESETKGTVVEWLAPQCAVIGTGAHEFYFNRDEFIRSVTAEVQERNDIEFRFDNLWCEQRKLTEDIYLVYGKVHIWWESEDKTIYINMDSRFTFIYQRIDGEWKIVHVHQSLLSQEQQEGEYYPKTLVEQVKEYKELADTDGLTGLRNFRAFQNQWEARTKPGYLFILDIDKFKAVNDTYGHVSGNKILIGMAETIRSVIRGNDLVCRMGGDEFLVYCSGMEAKADAIEFSHRLIRSINESGAKEQFWTTISVGGTYAPLGEALEIALENADKELYAAKKVHRGDCQIC